MRRATHLLAGVCVGLFIYGCGDSNAPGGSNSEYKEPISGRIVVLKGTEPRTLEFKYGRDLIDLSSMFLEGDRARPQDAPPSWKPGYEITFANKDGSTDQLIVSVDGQRWSNGIGERTVHGDFPAFLKSLHFAEFMVLLASSDVAIQKRGREKLAMQGDALIDALNQSMKSKNRYQQREAARRLRFLISPWVRTVVWGGVGRFSLKKIDRNVERPLSHPKAAEIRRVALAALKELLESYRQQARTSDGFSDSGRMGAYNDIVDCLAEVGDRGTADELARMLSGMKDTFRVMDLMKVLDRIYNLPPSFNPQPICPTGTPKSVIEEYQAAENARCNAAKEVLLQYHKQHRTDSDDEGIRAALSAWSQQIVVHDTWHDYSGLSDTTRRLEPIIRMGQRALPMIREKQNVAKDLAEKACYAFVVAFISGTLDEVLVRRLLAGSPKQHFLALQIIAAAESKEWKDELEQLQYACSYPHCEKVVQAASEALVACHGADALPLLKKAVAKYPWNLVAKSAITTLEQRQAR